jgi:membrane fusion protein
VTGLNLVAPVDGIVVDLADAVPGQSLASGEALLTIVPSGGTMRVRLRIPADAVAMVAPGQTARISIDAFPYQTYGTIPARIRRVSEASIGDGGNQAFTAIADLSTYQVSAYGQKRMIRPGMTVTARIRTMDRTLAQWLLDPLYAVSRR